MKKTINSIHAVIASSNTTSIAGHGSGWVSLAYLGGNLKKNGIDIAEFGYSKLRPFFESMPKEFEIHVDDSHETSVVYVRPVCKSTDVSTAEKPRVKVKAPRRTGKDNSDIRNQKFQTLESWAFLCAINIFLMKLANMAQREIWKYLNGLPSYPDLPILYSYIRYTFCRLQYQNKIVISIDGTMAAFNTGLTDNRYEPIIALFKKNRPGAISEWVFYDFVIAGEDRGKVINNKFDKEIESATYTEDPSELIYDVTLGAPIVDYDHIVIERVDRFPDGFIAENAPQGFEVKPTNVMNKKERAVYYEQLREAIKNDHSAYRNMINRIKDAILLALKRVHWNYKNAVPMFYPKENRMCLLLPLCLIDDSHEDVALVVKRTPAKKYEGATILPLDLAYADARVVARPNSEWLDAQSINGNGDSLI